MVFIELMFVDNDASSGLLRVYVGNCDAAAVSYSWKLLSCLRTHKDSFSPTIIGDCFPNFCVLLSKFFCLIVLFVVQTCNWFWNVWCLHFVLTFCPDGFCLFLVP